MYYGDMEISRTFLSRGSAHLYLPRYIPRYLYYTRCGAATSLARAIILALSLSLYIYMAYMYVCIVVYIFLPCFLFSFFLFGFFLARLVIAIGHLFASHMRKMRC
ncbi:hypothetical protein F5X99DRAFT_4033 [Biscogniauxia marginata]|nr:hypothetical protein F5X99DRAFT_4033 [Biscogniauxia marginata]